MILLILALVLACIVATEVVFFKYAKDNYDWGETFFAKKFLSFLCGLIFSAVFVGIPSSIAYIPSAGEVEAYGPVVLAWFYGVLGALTILFGINYMLYKRSINKKKKGGKKK